MFLTTRYAALVLALFLVLPASADDDAGWEVSAPPMETYEAGFDVTTGTWMSLDVSPDGREIAFDLLGDIYVMPIGGGEARALTRGIEWNMQPRYSPDGKWIAFTSDRSGGDNIWVMDRAGGNLHQVTNESFRLLNGPAWTPDGEYIAARKHFTGTRSAGAGEIWLYHRSGGTGLQLTSRPNDQKDVNEPAFSPDGRHLYFSQDTTPGSTFEYNKDPNDQIYVIRRLNRETGYLEDFVTGPGGAIRPTPSPDGRWLAYIRRIRGDSVLHLMDLRSGNETRIVGGLERDMQEIWAMHGVYPTLAWTPDSRAIVYWAGGRIHRLDMRDRRVSEIPFRVQDSRRLVEALRFKVEVAPERFSVKMLRWVQVAPDGGRVVYQALGHLWIRDLPDGTPRRLTRQDAHFEFYPSFSRDGRNIVYTTWHDRELGSVRVVPARGGTGRVLTPDPGHYHEPVFSPDGDTVVVRKGGGGGLISPDWSLDRGLHAIPTGRGQPRQLTTEGSQPHFGADSTRVYYSRPDGGKRLLSSVDMQGQDRRDHLRSEFATSFTLSPDARWVAFTERYNAWLAPFVSTGGVVDISPKMRSLPVRQVSRDAGDSLHWSGDSRSLHWSLGPELFTLDLKDAFPFIDGAPETLPPQPAAGRDISFMASHDKPSGTIALTGARLLTMRGDEVIEDGTIVVTDDRIVAVGPRDAVDIPRGARVLDASGKTIMPGLVDVHWHGAMGAGQVIPQTSWVNLASLAFGVTTIHDPSNDSATIFSAAEMARTGMITAPRIFSTGRILYGATTWFTAEVDSLDDARAHIRRLKAQGAVSVKSYNQPRRDQRQQFIKAAHELGIMVVPEGGALFQHNMNMVVDGHTGIEHALPVANVYDDVLQLWSQSRTGYTPTLGVAYGGIWGERYWYQHTDVWVNERLAAFVPQAILDRDSRRRTMAPESEYNHFRAAAHTKALMDAGVGIQLGAHGQREGLAVHWELWMFVQGGMTPLEAIRAGTLGGARYLGMDDDIGSIEPGKLADLIVLDGNPLEDIRRSESVRCTMINGRLHDAASMDEVWPRARQRGRMWWE